MKYPTLLAGAVALIAGGNAWAQDRTPAAATHVVVPQARSWRIGATQAQVVIERVSVKVTIREQAATTTLDIGLRNRGSRAAEAEVLLPVPDGAAVGGFAFEGAAKEPTARLLRHDEARRIYESIVRRTRDPALLEFAGYNLVRSSVFPVPAGGRQRVRLTYDHVLPADGGRVDYVLPRSESLAVKVPWEVEVEIRARSAVSTVYSPSHEMALTRHSPEHLTGRVRARAGIAPGPFRLSYLLERTGVTASLFAYPDPKIGGGYFLMLGGLPTATPADQPKVRREVTLVIDRSGSMAGTKMKQVRAAALQVIGALDEGEAFNVFDYSHTVESFSPKPVRRSAKTLEQAETYLAALQTLGGTNIHDALVESLRQPPAEGTLPLLLFLTDGLPTIGQTSEVAIRDAVARGNPHQRRVFAFGVGTDVNVPLLDRIAASTRAASAYVLPTEDVETKVGGVFRRLSTPVLAGGRLETLDEKGCVTTQAVRELIPAHLPDLFAGDQLVLLGQYRGEGPLVFRLSGSYFGDPREFRFEFDLARATTKHAFVPRLWASRRIAFLVDQIRQAGAPESGRPWVVGQSIFRDPRFRELAAEILRLSMEFGVLSEYTAFLATEGTDLGDWDQLALTCNGRLDDWAVRNRSGDSAVAASRNYASKLRQERVDYANTYYDSALRRVRGPSAVQQVGARSLFKRGDRWIEGHLAASRLALEPDRVVRADTSEYYALVAGLVAEGRQGLLARPGEILLRHRDRTVLVQNIWHKTQTKTKKEK